MVGHGVVWRWRRRRRSHHCVDTRGRWRHGDHVGLFKPHGVGRRETLDGLQGELGEGGPSRRTQPPPRHRLARHHSGEVILAGHCTAHARDTPRHARRTHTLRHGQGLDSEWRPPRRAGVVRGRAGRQWWWWLPAALKVAAAVVVFRLEVASSRGQIRPARVDGGGAGWSHHPRPAWGGRGWGAETIASSARCRGRRRPGAARRADPLTPCSCCLRHSPGAHTALTAARPGQTIHFES